MARTSLATTSMVRAVVLAICAAGIAGMIVSSALDHNGAALTFGLITAGAVVCLIVATAVGPKTQPSVDESRARGVEELVQRLVAGGADEPTVRQLVREASQLRKTDT